MEAPRIRQRASDAYSPNSPLHSLCLQFSEPSQRFIPPSITGVFCLCVWQYQTSLSLPSSLLSSRRSQPLQIQWVGNNYLATPHYECVTNSQVCFYECTRGEIYTNANIWQASHRHLKQNIPLELPYPWTQPTAHPTREQSGACVGSYSSKPGGVNE